MAAAHFFLQAEERRWRTRVSRWLFFRVSNSRKMWSCISLSNDVHCETLSRSADEPCNRERWCVSSGSCCALARAMHKIAQNSAATAAADAKLSDKHCIVDAVWMHSVQTCSHANGLPERLQCMCQNPNEMASSTIRCFREYGIDRCPGGKFRNIS